MECGSDEQRTFQASSRPESKGYAGGSRKGEELTEF